MSALAIEKKRKILPTDHIIYAALPVDQDIKLVYPRETYLNHLYKKSGGKRKGACLVH